jgi:hypothetical protein
LQQPSAREFGTGITKAYARHLFAVPYTAYSAMINFLTCCRVATGAAILFALKGQAEGAVHAAGGDVKDCIHIIKYNSII